MPPKSILKVKEAPQGSILTSASQSKEERNRALAIHHAELIQQQKDSQSEVFNSMLALIDLPSSPDADPALPSPADVQTLTTNLQTFQPSDYDELIEERHANGNCGYALCSRPFKKQSTTAKFRIVGKTSAQDMKVVSTESLEQWCSDACARRAMYLKVQLSSEPPWLRTSHTEIRIMPEHTIDLPLRPHRSSAQGGVDILRDGVEELRLERGDNDGSIRPQQVLKDDVLENFKTSSIKAPSPEEAGSYLDIEGYRPKQKEDSDDHSDASDDEEDRDWDI